VCLLMAHLGLREQHLTSSRGAQDPNF